MARADQDTLTATHHAFHSTDAAWSEALAAHYGKPGSKGYDVGRYRTDSRAWPESVRLAWADRARAYHEWAKARDLLGACVYDALDRA